MTRSKLPIRFRRDNPGAREIGFAIPERYNASRILFDNLATAAATGWR